MRRLALLLLLGGCGATPPPPAAMPREVGAMVARVQLIGATLRIAAACGMAVQPAAKDQGALIEAAVLDLHHSRGGVAARDAFLDSMRPPEAAGRRAEAAWCAGRRTDVAAVERFLLGEPGRALAAQVAAR